MGNKLGIKGGSLFLVRGTDMVGGGAEGAAAPLTVSHYAAVAPL